MLSERTSNEFRIAEKEVRAGEKICRNVVRKMGFKRIIADIKEPMLVIRSVPSDDILGVLRPAKVEKKLYPCARAIKNVRFKAAHCAYPVSYTAPSYVKGNLLERTLCKRRIIEKSINLEPGGRESRENIHGVGRKPPMRDVLQRIENEDALFHYRSARIAI